MYIFSQKIKQMMGLKPFISAFFVCMVQYLGARLLGGFASGLKGFLKSAAVVPARGFGIKSMMLALGFCMLLAVSPILADDIGPGNWPNVFPDIPTFNAKILTKKGPVQSWTVDYIWKKPSLNRYEKQRGQNFNTFIVENNAETGTISELAKELNLASDEWITPTWEYPNFKYLDNYYDFTLKKENLNIRKYKGTLKSNVSDFAKSRYWEKVWITVDRKSNRITQIKTNIIHKKIGSKSTTTRTHNWQYGTIETVPVTCVVSSAVLLPGKNETIDYTYERRFYFNFIRPVSTENLRDKDWKSNFRKAQEGGS